MVIGLAFAVRPALTETLRAVTKKIALADESSRAAISWSQKKWQRQKCKLQNTVQDANPVQDAMASANADPPCETSNRQKQPDNCEYTSCVASYHGQNHAN